MPLAQALTTLRHCVPQVGDALKLYFTFALVLRTDLKWHAVGPELAIAFKKYFYFALWRRNAAQKAQ